jgi:hyperosmotically inducible protein
LRRQLRSFLVAGAVDEKRSRTMRRVGIFGSVVFLGAAIAGCSHTQAKSPDVSGDVRRSLDQAGFKDVSVSQDRDNGVVTLGGHVAGDGDKAQAESIAKSLAGGQVVADQIAVIPPGADNVKTINSDLDEAIEKNLDAALLQDRLSKDVKYHVKTGVVTLTGTVRSESQRGHVAQVAASVPNVRQVVNELQVKDQKATSVD